MLLTLSNIFIFPRFQSTHQLPLYYGCNILAYSVFFFGINVFKASRFSQL